MSNDSNLPLGPEPKKVPGTVFPTVPSEQMKQKYGSKEADLILDRFRFHPATPETGPLHDVVRNTHQAVAAVILDNVPAGRHQSLALTALQESMMWCNAAIACDTKSEGPHAYKSPFDSGRS